MFGRDTKPALIRTAISRMNARNQSGCKVYKCTCHKEQTLLVHWHRLVLGRYLEAFRNGLEEVHPGNDPTLGHWNNTYNFWGFLADNSSPIAE